MNAFDIQRGTVGMVRIPILGFMEVQMVPLASEMVVDENIWPNNTLLGASDVEGR